MAQGKLSPLGLYVFILLSCNNPTSYLEIFARNFCVVPVVAPDLQLVTKEVPKDHVQVMLEKCKARHSKHRTEETEVRSLKIRI